MLFETKRLYFRKLTLDDVSHVEKLVCDPICMYIYPDNDDYRTALPWIERQLDRYQKYNTGLFACFRKEDQEFMGLAGITHRENIEGREEDEVGYLIVRKHWRQGYGFEAAIGSIQKGFNLGLGSIIALIQPQNTASIKTAEKAGMRYEKTILFHDVPHKIYRINKNFT